jgi:hypothetical protein
LVYTLDIAIHAANILAVVAMSAIKFCSGSAGVDPSVPEQSLWGSAEGVGGGSGGVSTSPAFATTPNRVVVSIQIATKRLSRIIMFFVLCFWRRSLASDGMR